MAKKLTKQQARDIYQPMFINPAVDRSSILPPSRYSYGTQGQPQPTPNTLDYLPKELAKEAVKQVGNLTAGAVIRTGTLPIDAYRLLRNQEPLPAFDVPYLGTQKSLARNVFDQKMEQPNRSDLEIGLKAGSQALLDLAATGVVGKGVVHGARSLNSWASGVANPQAGGINNIGNAAVQGGTQKDVAVKNWMGSLREKLQAVKTGEIKATDQQLINSTQHHMAAQLDAAGEKTLATKIRAITSHTIDDFKQAVTNVSGVSAEPTPYLHDTVRQLQNFDKNVVGKGGAGIFSAFKSIFSKSKPNQPTQEQVQYYLDLMEGVRPKVQSTNVPTNTGDNAMLLSKMWGINETSETKNSVQQQKNELDKVIKRFANPYTEKTNFEKFAADPSFGKIINKVVDLRAAEKEFRDVLFDGVSNQNRQAIPTNDLGTPKDPVFVETIDKLSAIALKAPKEDEFGEGFGKVSFVHGTEDLDINSEEVATVQGLIREQGFQKAQETLRAKYGNAQGIDKGHVMAHFLGSAAYNELGTEKALQICDNNLQYGCYHGVIEEIITAEGSLPKAKEAINSLVKDLAPASDPDNLNMRDYMIVHGVGHGVMGITQNLPTAIKMCNSLDTDENNQRSCRFGAIMEFNQRNDKFADTLKYLNEKF